MFRNKSDLLLKSLQGFFLSKNGERMKEILPILEGKSKLSLRLIDWFVTNFSKHQSTRIKYDNDSTHCIIYLDYKSQLKAFSKKQFDPFCRRNRIQFFYTDTDYIDTTIGQLNFFRWALQKGILQYLQTHVQQIEKEMNLYHKRKSIMSSSSGNTIKTANKHKNVSIILTFE